MADDPIFINSRTGLSSGFGRANATIPEWLTQVPQLRDAALASGDPGALLATRPSISILRAAMPYGGVSSPDGLPYLPGRGRPVPGLATAGAASVPPVAQPLRLPTGRPQAPANSLRNNSPIFGPPSPVNLPQPVPRPGITFNPANVMRPPGASLPVLPSLQGLSPQTTNGITLNAAARWQVNNPGRNINDILGTIENDPFIRQGYRSQVYTPEEIVQMNALQSTWPERARVTEARDVAVVNNMTRVYEQARPMTFEQQVASQTNAYYIERNMGAMAAGATAVNAPTPSPGVAPSFDPVDPAGGVDTSEDWGKDDSDQAAVAYASTDVGGDVSSQSLKAN